MLQLDRYGRMIVLDGTSKITVNFATRQGPVELAQNINN